MDLNTESREVLKLWDRAFTLREEIIETEGGEQAERAVQRERFPSNDKKAFERSKHEEDVNWIGTLQMLTSKRIGRSMQKDEIQFVTESLEGKVPAFRSTVNAVHFDGGPFVGELCSSKKAAHHSAAKAAVELEFPDEQRRFHLLIDQILDSARVAKCNLFLFSFQNSIRKTILRRCIVIDLPRMFMLYSDPRHTESKPLSCKSLAVTGNYIHQFVGIVCD